MSCFASISKNNGIYSSVVASIQIDLDPAVEPAPGRCGIARHRPALAESGRIDGLVTDMLPGYDWLNSKQGADYTFVGENIDIDDKIGIAIRKGDDNLRQRLNKAMNEILADDTFKNINAKYFPFSIY